MKLESTEQYAKRMARVAAEARRNAEREKVTWLISHRHRYGPGSPLLHCPQPISGQGEPKLEFLRDYGAEVDAVQFSIVMPVHNQEDIIARTLASAIACASGLFEVIVVVDACGDRTLDVVLDLLRPHGPNDPPPPQSVCGGKLARCVVVSCPTPVFETTCDNIGFVCARGTYVVDVQADIEVRTPGYTDLLAEPCQAYDDVVGVSGRCGHDLGLDGGHVGYPRHEPSGRHEPGEHQPEDAFNAGARAPDADAFHVRATCNRGPLLLDRAKLAHMNYLDEENFVLGDDEHDLFLRAYVSKKWVCGYRAMHWYSEVAWGSTRKAHKRDHTNRMALDIRRSRSDHFKFPNVSRSSARPLKRRLGDGGVLKYVAPVDGEE